MALETFTPGQVLTAAELTQIIKAIDSPIAETIGYVAVAGDMVLMDATGGARTVTLPAVSAGISVLVKKTDSSANAVTVSPASGTIDGATSVVLSTRYSWVRLVSDGTNWYKVSSFVNVATSSFLTGDVTMTNANTFYDSAAITPVAGSYLLLGPTTIGQSGASLQENTAKLWDGTTVLCTANALPNSGGDASACPIMFVVTDGTHTYKVSAASQGTTSTIKATAAANGTTNTASGIIAVRFA